jgi:hypothetical protein
MTNQNDTKTSEPALSFFEAEGSIKGNQTMLAEAAGTFRRMVSKDEPDAQGLNTIWHRGQLRSELLSWETSSGIIEKQEFTFAGMAIVINKSKGIFTGCIEAPETDPGRNRINDTSIRLLQMDNIVNLSTLEYAAHFMKHIPKRDFYTQHLLKEINDAITNSGFDASCTSVSSLNDFGKTFSKKFEVPKGIRMTSEPEPEKQSSSNLLIICFAAGIVLAALAAFFLS